MEEILYIINPDRSKPWNDLPSLPIREELFKTVEIYESLVEAKSALARLHGRSAVIPNQGLLVNTISLQEAKISSEIENIFTTDDELYKSYSDSTSNIKGAAKEVLRYREALWSGYNYLNQSGCFDRVYFINVFQQIKETTEGIRKRLSNTVIKKGGTGPQAGSVIYTPPRGVGIIEEKLDNLIDFLNDDEQYKVDHLLKMAIAHYQYEAIHPFTDGNGRTGRILNINYLTKKGLLDTPILFLSRYILDHKEDYYQGLQGVSQRGDWRNWILFILRAVQHTSNITYHKVNEIVEAKNSMLQYIIEEAPKLRRPDQLVEALFTQPFTKVNHLTEAGIYAENTARSYLNELVKIGAVQNKKLGSTNYYLNAELYRILSE